MRLKQNLVWSYINWAVSIAVPLVMIPIYLRCLGRETYGAWIVILSVTSYLSLANLGIGQTLGNRIAEAVAKDKRDEIGPLISTAFFGYAAIAVVLMAALFLFTPMIARRLALGASAAVIAPFFIYVVLTLISFPVKVFPMVLRSFERVDQEQAIVAASNVVRIAALAAALFSGFKLEAVAAVNGSAEILLPLAAFWQSRRLTAEARPRLKRFSRALLLDMVQPSLGFLGIQVANTLITGVDALVIGYSLGAAAVTAYSVPFRVTTMLVGLLSVAANAVNPSVTVNYAQGTRNALARGYMFSLRLSTLYGTAGAIALWVIGPPFFRVWAGAGVFPGYRAYALMLVLFVMVVLIMPASSILWATTRHYIWAMMSLGEGALNLALSLWWVRRFGLTGVIGATVTASALLTFWYLPYAALKTLEVPIGDALRELAPGFALSALAIGAVALLWNAHADAPLLYALGWGTAAVLGYALVFAWLGFSRSQRQRAVGWIVASRRQASAA
ncbi:MAG TPA: oligosaccharide flippase family protein [Candidatus Acidoferrales bacterium]|nr:oligosaccharide flippase family protein [Candidatus Acidoferrales bacterium]